MRKIIQIAPIQYGKLYALCSDGTMWHGTLVDEESKFMRWEAINSPPDGEIAQRKRKPFWDRMEAKYAAE